MHVACCAQYLTLLSGLWCTVGCAVSRMVVCLEHRVDCECIHVYLNAINKRSRSQVHMCVWLPRTRLERQMHARVEFGVWKWLVDESEESVPAASVSWSPMI